jgi:hypothetical protein
MFVDFIGETFEVIIPVKRNKFFLIKFLMRMNAILGMIYRIRVINHKLE